MSINEMNDKQIRVDIRVSRREWLLLRKLASEAGLGPIEYITNIVRQWTNSQLKGAYRKHFEKLNALDCANLFGDIDDAGEIKFANSKIDQEKKRVREKYKDKIKDKIKES